MLCGSDLVLSVVFLHGELRWSEEDASFAGGSCRSSGSGADGFSAVRKAAEGGQPLRLCFGLRSKRHRLQQNRLLFQILLSVRHHSSLFFYFLNSPEN